MGTTKIGVPAKLLAGFAYLAAFFSGYLAFLLIGGYILLREQNDWLRFHAVKAGILMACFSVANTVIGLIPNLFAWLGDIVDLFGGHFHPAFIYDAQDVLSSTLSILEKILFLLLAFFAFRGGDLGVGPLDKLVNSLLAKVPSASGTVPEPAAKLTESADQRPENK